MKKVFKMFTAAIALAFAAVACKPAQPEIVPDEATYAIFTEAYKALTDQYNANTAATILNTAYGDEKYAEVVAKYTLVFSTIETKIKDLKATADAFYADNVLADHIEELKAAILDLQAELEKAVEDFGAEITAIDESNIWVKIGVGTLNEPFSTMFGYDALVLSVDVYQDSNHPGLYMYKGVGLQLANWFYEQDMTAYKGQYWDDEGIIFDATDPDKVVIDNQSYGLNAGSSYGWPTITTIANGQTVGYGKLANGHLTLTAREYLVGMGTSFYYGPAGYDLALPSAATSVAPSKVNYAKKGERSVRTLVAAPASAK